MPKFIYLMFAVLFFSACSDADYPVPDAVPVPKAETRSVSFDEDIRPIVETKCIACHACFDAPCQLKMESSDGIVRGANIREVYNGTRTEAQMPSRLGIDAHSESEWRALDFYSVLHAYRDEPALMANMLTLAKQYPFESNSKLPSELAIGTKRQNQCPTPDNFHEYAKKHPLEGMPMAVSGLTDQEYALMMGWLEQGAAVDSPNKALSADDQAMLEEWEAYLNVPDKRRQLVARWLYEHLFLAHLYFETASLRPQFFELLRSTTPPGEPIKPVQTRLPNDDPESDFYYRLRPITGSIVHKRHITFQFGETLQNRIETLFYSDEWSVDTLPGYAYADRANPFMTFSAIPAKARYQFMLDHAEYFTRTFIRGPVCRGQIATDVIRDNFWVMYQDPDRDLYITNQKYQDEVSPLLGLPGQNDDLLEAGGNWDKYRDKRNAYQDKRYAAYRQHAPEWASLSSVWDGDGHNPNALLTVFRHFDSASVLKGLVGKVPQTIWWMDYPIFERSYYELVVNFDVYGNLAHQLQTRLYFDLIRNGAEHNFLRLMPHETRGDILDSWYEGIGAIKTHISYAKLDEETPTTEDFSTHMPKQEFAGRLLETFAAVNAMGDDPLNRCNGNDCFRPDQDDWIQQSDQQLASISGLTREDLAGLSYLPELTFLRVSYGESDRSMYSLLRNRAHSNVAFLFGESLRHQPEKDTLSIYPGIAGSYPNFIFDVPAADLPDFVSQLAKAEDESAFEDIVIRWGVRRTSPDFWQIFHDFTAWQREQQPLEAGIFDANRYVNL
ncbi:fatty acid cis/trans isomerase [Methylophaga sp. OBS3]|uniref:fatty acid cis/trans isomerase n=1 Tax=Methylophaga sp. OBS3 TaxID=2991934 RepID=UPI0022555EBB|nr:fatty acid cis/trans isomerase [Methylophaga sp. OBS3]MCX4190398.1 fatty acid cis/trans isomerase [Methylophaga sp. OBS3]